MREWRSRLLALALMIVIVSAAAVADDLGRLPLRQLMPTRINPFIFYHQRKTGGSSLREEIAASSRKNRLNYYIPCLTGDCSRLQPRDWATQQVMAGHLDVDYVQSEVPRGMLQQKISCLTVFREPLERVRSCYYFSTLDTLFSPHLKWGKLTPAQMEWVLTEAKRGRMCTNEPVRIFSGRASSILISRLYKNPGPAQELVARAHDNLAKCVVLMQEDFNLPVTTRILSHWFPWLNHTQVMVNTTPKKPRTETMSEQQTAFITKLLAAEISLYNTARDMYNAQIRYLDSLEDPEHPAQALPFTNPNPHIMMVGRQGQEHLARRHRRYREINTKDYEDAENGPVAF